MVVSHVYFVPENTHFAKLRSACKHNGVDTHAPAVHDHDDRQLRGRVARRRQVHPHELVRVLGAVGVVREEKFRRLHY